MYCMYGRMFANSKWFKITWFLNSLDLNLTELTLPSQNAQFYGNICHRPNRSSKMLVILFTISTLPILATFGRTFIKACRVQTGSEARPMAGRATGPYLNLNKNLKLLFFPAPQHCHFTYQWYTRMHWNSPRCYTIGWSPEIIIALLSAPAFNLSCADRPRYDTHMEELSLAWYCHYSINSIQLIGTLPLPPSRWG